MVFIGRVSSLGLLHRFVEAISVIGEAKINTDYRISSVSLYCICVELCRDCNLRKVRSEIMYKEQ